MAFLWIFGIFGWPRLDMAFLEMGVNRCSLFVWPSSSKDTVVGMGLLNLACRLPPTRGSQRLFDVPHTGTFRRTLAKLGLLLILLARFHSMLGWQLLSKSPMIGSSQYPSEEWNRPTYCTIRLWSWENKSFTFFRKGEIWYSLFTSGTF